MEETTDNARRRAVRVLVAVVALMAGAAASHAQSYALGLQLPKEALAFYVLGEDTAWGLESSLYLHRGSFSRTYPLPTPDTYTQRSSNPDSIGVFVGLIYQRTVRAGPVAPFLFASASGSFGWGRHPPTRDKTSRLSWELAVGAGAAWRPFDSVALWVRQGWALARDIEDSCFGDGVEIHEDILSLRLARPAVLAVFTW